MSSVLCGGRAPVFDSTDGMMRMEVWHYTSVGGLHALTLDEGGDNLPYEPGPWTVRKRVILRVDCPDEQEAITLIREHGFCCFD